ncbi:MAG: dihydrofolate reductase [Chitinophagaceae bacterium]|nr:dihydrofolate reductase [Chitinophagaceae bacterium]
MIVKLVVAASKNNAIGKNNQLLWHLPKDMRFFKNTTWAMPVIMGRKTFESLSGKALNGRLNIVLTRQENWTAENVVAVKSLDEAYAFAKSADYKEVYVIGGAEIYSQALPKADFVYLTRVDAEIEGDSFFPALGAEWKLLSEEIFAADSKHAYPFSFQIWKQNKLCIQPSH